MKRALKKGAAALVLAFLLLAVYGTAIEPRFLLDERRYEVSIPAVATDAPAEPVEIAVFSDIQVGMWWANTGMARRVAERAVAATPDAVVIAGDFVYGKSPDVPAQVDTVMDVLAPVLGARIPVYAVLGNHDYKADAAEELIHRLTDAGVRVLRNEAAVLAGSQEHPFYIVGIGAYRPGLSDPDAAFDDVPAGAPRLVVMHNPASYPAVASGNAPIAVAGHTHCGQVAIPGTPVWSYFELLREERVVVDGFAPAAYGAAGNRLYVTCGVGFSLVPARVFAPPQVVTFEIRQEARGG